MALIVAAGGLFAACSPRNDTLAPPPSTPAGSGLPAGGQGQAPSSLLPTTVSAVAELPDDVDVATAHALLERDDVYVLDVRTPEEFAAGRVPGSVLIPVDDLAARMAEVPKDKTIVTSCRSGRRSGIAAKMLRDAGYADVHNMAGGMIAWTAAGYGVER